MPVLHNFISNKELKKHMLNENKERTTVSFYKYFQILNPKIFRDDLYINLTKLEVFGRVYVAHEGINAQISVPTNRYQKMKEMIYTFDPALNNIRMNIALDDNGKSFWVLRLKVRKRIVADGIEDNSFNSSKIGNYIKAIDVNRMLDDPNTIFIDMRNYYEYEVGHFDTAIAVPADRFRDQLPMVVNMLKKEKHKNIVMYCTGGIRCEKASAWMKYNGFHNVYHIEGGIIEYIRCARQLGLPIRFRGKNFVFDERMAERISKDIISSCHQCNMICDSHTNCINNSCHLLFIQCPSCANKYNNCCSIFCMNHLNLSYKEQIKARLTKNGANANKIFNKSYGLIKYYNTHFKEN
ncbi:rhodanese-related sulfurtransferase [Pantoea sp. Aalb]|uniref:oxygen-dependent tRNA uridine(34) hydroxylase TrhO n=1 Tax=Pantoea sp. Aalb TaxID=2576762 RepID=UPI00132C48FC|nr:rhodanese-related sulfurtransferase [Pantoea sp. Aalb]MXP67473.1 rhodanese-related sulfurtransferase [Pantoea sp. Aalb]